MPSNPPRSKAAPLHRPPPSPGPPKPSMALPPGATREFHAWGKTCKYCGKGDLRWVAIVEGTSKKWILEERAATPSGVQTHKCPEYNRTVERVTEPVATATVASEPEKAPDNYGDW